MLETKKRAVRRAAETPHQRDQRLARRREYERARRAALSSEQSSQGESRDELSDKELDSEHPKEQPGQPTAQADLRHIDLKAEKFSIEELENEPQSQKNTDQEFKKE